MTRESWARVLAIIAGCFLPVQFAMNSALAQSTGAVTLTACISYLVGSLTLGVLLATGYFGRLRWEAARSAPWWSYLGGVTGCWYVISSAYFTARLGVSVTTALVIGGQTLSGLVIDHFGWLSSERRRLNPLRLLSGALLVVAVLLVRG